MQLHELKKSPGRHKPWKRVGRGNASGAGNYSGKGIKGQKSRAGGSIPAWFEGGQTPLYRRLPKLRWFKRYFKLLNDHEPVNVWSLDTDERIKSGDTITKETLVQYSYIRKASSFVKILGTWDLGKKLTFDGMDAISASALSKVESAGWSFDNQVVVEVHTKKERKGDQQETEQQEQSEEK